MVCDVDGRFCDEVDLAQRHRNDAGGVASHEEIDDVVAQLVGGIAAGQAGQSIGEPNSVGLAVFVGYGQVEPSFDAEISCEL